MEEMREIFIIDNIDSNIEFYSNLLTLKGYKITAASSVDEFFRKTYEIEPDLVIYDTDMPRNEADKFLRLMTKLSRFSATPVLFLTGFVSDIKISCFKNLRNSEFLSKDSPNKRVLDRVNFLMGRNGEDDGLFSNMGHGEKATDISH